MAGSFKPILFTRAAYRYSKRITAISIYFNFIIISIIRITASTFVNDNEVAKSDEDPSA